MIKGSWEEWYVRTGEDQLRDLAREVWDPIGTGRLTPKDELDRYLPDLVDAVRRAGGPEDLARYLTNVEHRYFVPDRTEDELIPAARKMLDWYEQAPSPSGYQHRR